MSVLTLHSEAWTVGDLEQLPDSGNRYEIIDGSLLVAPPPSLSHEAVAFRLGTRLDAVAPDNVQVLTGGGIHIPPSFLVPDVLVVRSDAVLRGKYANASDVLLVAEVVSPSSRTTDPVMKRMKYAEVGIQNYWIIHQDPMRILVLTLVDGVYEEKLVKDGRFEVTEPFPVAFDLGALLPK